MRKAPKAKEPIRLRAKRLSNGNQSLYLDYYHKGTRQYEFLKLYLIPERTDADRAQNEETMRSATAYKSTKIIELQNNQLGFNNTRLRGRVNLIDYLRSLAAAHKQAGRINTYNNYASAINHLIQYAGRNTEIAAVDKAFCLGFIKYLKSAKALVPEKLLYQRNKGKTLDTITHNSTPKALVPNTQFNYFAVLDTALNAAVRDELITVNPISRINPKDKLKRSAPDRCYLTFDEVKRFAAAPTVTVREEHAARAFLFSCFCGLRMSDIAALTWAQIKPQSDNTLQVELTQVKTKQQLYLPLSSNAVKFLPPRPAGATTEKIFKLPSRYTISQTLNNVARRAGIDKHVTFHVARHTFATLDLAFGADLYTVSKLLGHTKITTTQIYAKIIDESKRKAVDLIPDIVTPTNQ